MYVCLLSLLYVALTNQRIFNLFSKGLWYIISKIIQVFFILIQAGNMELNDSCTVLYRTFLKAEILQVTEYITGTKSIHCMCIKHLAQLVRCNACI